MSSEEREGAELVRTAEKFQIDSSQPYLDTQQSLQDRLSRDGVGLSSTLKMPMVRGNGQGWQYLLPPPPQLSAGFTPVEEGGGMDPDCCLGLWLWPKQQFSIYTLFGGNTRECPFSNNYKSTNHRFIIRYPFAAET